MFKKRDPNKILLKLEKRICNIENPYKFDIKDVVIFNIVGEPEIATIVDKNFDYCSQYRDLLLTEKTFITNYPLEFYETQGNMVRVNKYLLLPEKSNISFWVEELYIKHLNK